MNIRMAVFCILSMLYLRAGFGYDTLSTKTKRIISIQSGASRHIVQDDIISPLVYSGTQVPLFVNYQSVNDKYIQSVSAYFDYVKLTSSISVKIPTEAFYTKNYNGFIAYSYARRVYKHRRSNITTFAGGQFKTLVNLRDHYYSDYTHYSTGELIGNLSLSVSVTKMLGKTKQDFLLFRYNMSLLAYDLKNYLYNANVAKELNQEASQNSVHNLSKENKLVSINHYADFQTEIAYVKFVTNHLGFSIRHYFLYYKEDKYKDLLTVRYTNMQLLLGVTLKLN